MPASAPAITAVPAIALAPTPSGPRSIGSLSLASAGGVVVVETLSEAPAAVAAPLPMPVQLQAVASNVVQMPPLRRRLEQKVLVQLASGGKGLPFFWVHGVGGEVFSYVQLSRHLAEKRPVYGFTADWSQLGGDQLPTLEEMAALYVSEMRKVQPAGPYFMGGFCSASMLALEMARQIEADGERVGLLAAIDYDLVPVETSPSGVKALFAFLRNVPRWLREDAMASGMQELAGRVRSRLRNLVNGLKKSRGKAKAPKEVDFRDAHGMWRFPDYQVAMLKAHHQAINSYQPKSLNGRVALFIPRTMPLLGPWPAGQGAQWDDIARGGVEVHHVRGSHTTMLKEPFVEALGKQLNSCIDEAEPRPEGRPPHSILQSTTAGAAVALSMPIIQ
jgi:thioesterase domain-containing protein